MSTKTLSILLPALLGVVALVAFVGVGFIQARTTAEAGTAPNLAQFISGFVRKERAAEAGAGETVAAVGEAPASQPLADAPEEDAPEEVVATRAETAPSSWFRRDRNAKEVRVEFTCVMGVGGSKVCTAETMKR